MAKALVSKTDLDQRADRLSKICKTINDGAFGGDNKDAVTWLGSRDAVAIDRFSSGCVELDEALGGGWPKGRFIEIFGPEASGKSTLMLHAIAEHQKKYPDEDCALLDLEFSFDQEYAENVGVNTKYLIVHQPDGGEQALNVLRQLISAGVKCIVVDSVAALTTRAEVDGDLGDIHVGEQARLMSQSLKTLTMEAGRTRTTVLWTNQIREKIGVLGYGEKTTTPAGRALKHYASIRVQINSIGKVKEKVDGEDVVVSTKNKAVVKKNKCSPPFRVAEFCISFGFGVDKVAGILDSAMSLGVIKKRGAWLSMEGDQLGCGRAAVLDRMRKEPELTDKIEKAVAAAKNAGVQPESAGDVEKTAYVDETEGEDQDAIIPGAKTTEVVDV